MKELPPCGKLELLLGTAAVIGMCAVFLLGPTSACEVKTTRDWSGNSAVQSEEGKTPHSLLPGEKIPINTADQYDLGRLPGIGDTRAQAIVDFRDRHGPFKRLEQIRRVKGIDAKHWAEIKDYICLYEDGN